MKIAPLVCGISTILVIGLLANANNQRADENPGRSNPLPGKVRNLAMANRLLTIFCLFAVVAQLTAIRGFAFGQLLFVAPVLFALLFSTRTPVTRGVILARLYLSLIAFGLFIANCPWLFPDLGGVDPKLPRESDRVLTWYCAIYLLFCTFLMPLHVFTQALHQERLGMHSQFSRPTCYLGLFTALILTPGTIWILIRFLHLWPVL